MGKEKSGKISQFIIESGLGDVRKTLRWLNYDCVHTEVYRADAEMGSQRNVFAHQTSGSSRGKSNYAKREQLSEWLVERNLEELYEEGKVVPISQSWPKKCCGLLDA